MIARLNDHADISRGRACNAMQRGNRCSNSAGCNAPPPR